MSRNRCDGLLAKVDFPLYTLQTLTNRHVLVAGGGGASNTGVANGFVSIVIRATKKTCKSRNFISIRVSNFTIRDNSCLLTIFI